MKLLIKFVFCFQIFALNARLAAAESMTHDVIRDLLGVKLDMTNYAVSIYSLMLIFPNNCDCLDWEYM